MCCYCTQISLCVLFNMWCPVLLENSQIPRSEERHTGVDRISAPEATTEPVTDNCIAEALQRTSKAIQDIDAVLSAATLT